MLDQNVQNEGTTPDFENLEPQSQIDTEQSTEDTTPGTDDGDISGAANNGDNENSSADADNPDNGSTEDVTPLTIPIRFNHENFDLSPEEAAVLAQKGKLFEQNQAVFDQVTYLSERLGTSPDQVLENLLDSIEKADLEKAIEESGGDAYQGQKLYEKNKSEIRRRIDARQKEAAADNDYKTYRENKIADEFLKYKNEMGCKDIKDVPQAVIDTAVKEKISLFDAFLRHKYKNEGRRQKNENKKQQNAGAAVGNLGGNKEDDDFKSDIADMLKY